MATFRHFKPEKKKQQQNK